MAGSHARGEAHENSDIDLVLLTIDPEAFRRDAAWLDAIDWTTVEARRVRHQDEDYGVLWSRRVWLEQNRGEIEFGFAPPSWASIDPIDLGTRRVVMAGFRILYDPDCLLNRLFAALIGCHMY